MNQPDFFTATSPADSTPEHVTETDQSDFRSALFSGQWITRETVAQNLGWKVRKVRAVAQSLGGQIIRCQQGYKLTAVCTRNDLPMMTQAADAAGSQAGHMRAYELEVRKAIHALVG